MLFLGWRLSIWVIKCDSRCTCKLHLNNGRNISNNLDLRIYLISRLSDWSWLHQLIFIICTIWNYPPPPTNSHLLSSKRSWTCKVSVNVHQAWWRESSKNYAWATPSKMNPLFNSHHQDYSIFNREFLCELSQMWLLPGWRVSSTSSALTLDLKASCCNIASSGKSPRTAFITHASFESAMEPLGLEDRKSQSHGSRWPRWMRNPRPNQLRDR